MSAPQDDAPSGWLLVPSHESLYRLFPRSELTPGPPWEPSPPSDFSKDKMITLLVGADEHELLAHEDYLARHSAFFKAARSASLLSVLPPVAFSAESIRSAAS